MSIEWHLEIFVRVEINGLKYDWIKIISNNINSLNGCDSVTNFYFLLYLIILIINKVIQNESFESASQSISHCTFTILHWNHLVWRLMFVCKYLPFIIISTVFNFIRNEWWWYLAKLTKPSQQIASLQKVTNLKAYTFCLGKHLEMFQIFYVTNRLFSARGFINYHRKYSQHWIHVVYFINFINVLLFSFCLSGFNIYPNIVQYADLCLSTVPKKREVLY